MISAGIVAAVAAYLFASAVCFFAITKGTGISFEQSGADGLLAPLAAALALAWPLILLCMIVIRVGEQAKKVAEWLF